MAETSHFMELFPVLTHQDQAVAIVSSNSSSYVDILLDKAFLAPRCFHVIRF
jgi:hypothetical protein